MGTAVDAIGNGVDDVKLNAVHSPRPYHPIHHAQRGKDDLQFADGQLRSELGADLDCARLAGSTPTARTSAPSSPPAYLVASMSVDAKRLEYAIQEGRAVRCSPVLVLCNTGFFKSSIQISLQHTLQQSECPLPDTTMPSTMI